MRHFCDAVMATSTSHSSKAKGIPPNADTPSTNNIALRVATTRAIAATSFRTAVDVSQ
jgi:hypothetical protein